MNETEFKDSSVTSANHRGSMPGSGGGMDRVVKKKKWPPQKIALIVGVVLFVGAVGYGLWTMSGGTKLRVQTERLTIAAAQTGEFQEFISVIGTLEPLRTVFLDAAEGGRVEQIFVEEGAILEAEDPILRLINNNLQLDLLNREAQFYETMNYLRQARLDMEQNTLNLRQQLLDINYQITRLRRQQERNEELYEKALISDEEYRQIKDELEYQERRRELTLASHRQDSLMRQVQVEQLEASVTRMQRNLDVVRLNLENLVVKAPITGQLTSLNAEIGQSISDGQRLGQIDRFDGFKVNVPVDEHYLPRVNTGQEGTFTLSNEEYDLEINKVYPEVQNGLFEVDMVFDAEAPDGVRRGQTLRIRLQLGDLSEALLIPRGGFFQTTGGNWIFVVEGDQAVRRPIRLGRQNPQHFEVLEGLQEGDRVVTSSYDTYGDAEILILQD